MAPDGTGTRSRRYHDQNHIGGPRFSAMDCHSEIAGILLFRFDTQFPNLAGKVLIVKVEFVCEFENLTDT